MTYTMHNVIFNATVEVYGRTHNVRCTASWRFEDTPALLWIENNGSTPRFQVPGDVWDEVERQLRDGGPAQDAYAAALKQADLPFMYRGEEEAA